MNDVVVIGGETYISSRRASEISGYSRDHIGYLARRGDISARQVGGNWYISELSLSHYKKKIDAIPSKLPTASSREQDPESIISLDGREYVSAQKGAELTGYHEDYVGQLCREGKILSRRIGTRWFIEREALVAHRKEKNALLAAVQAEAVGLGVSKRIAIRTQEDAGGPYMIYSSDYSDLAPVLKAKSSDRNTVYRQDEMPISSHISDIRPSADPLREFSWNMKKKARRERRGAIGGITVAAATIVIAITIGYISYGEKAIYAYRNLENGNYALSGKAMDVLESALVAVESVIAPEVGYQRVKGPENANF